MLTCLHTILILIILFSIMINTRLSLIIVLTTIPLKLLYLKWFLSMSIPSSLLCHVSILILADPLKIRWKSFVLLSSSLISVASLLKTRHLNYSTTLFSPSFLVLTLLTFLPFLHFTISSTGSILMMFHILNDYNFKDCRMHGRKRNFFMLVMIGINIHLDAYNKVISM